MCIEKHWSVWWFKQVQSAVDDMLSAECPSEIQTGEGSDVKLFKDYEENQSMVSGITVLWLVSQRIFFPWTHLHVDCWICYSLECCLMFNSLHFSHLTTAYMTAKWTCRFNYCCFLIIVVQYNGDERGTPVRDVEAFCGRWSLKNPEILFMNTFVKPKGGSYGSITLKLHKMVGTLPPQHLSTCCHPTSPVA